MNWFKRLTGGLNKTASGIKKSIGSIFKGNKLDVSKLESNLGYKPQMTVEQGVLRFVKRYKKYYTLK